MFLTFLRVLDIALNGKHPCRNPLKSGQCFLPKDGERWNYLLRPTSRNPLKSGQCFLHGCRVEPDGVCAHGYVAIPSNRVNVSYSYQYLKQLKKQLEVAIPSNRVNVSYYRAR